MCLQGCACRVAGWLPPRRVRVGELMEPTAALHSTVQHRAAPRCTVVSGGAGTTVLAQYIASLSTLCEQSGAVGAAEEHAVPEQEQSAGRRAASNMRALLTTFVLSGQASAAWANLRLPRSGIPWYQDNMAQLGVYLSYPASALPHT